MPDLKSHFFNLQLKLLSHEQQSVINVDDNVLVIRIEAEPDVRIFGKASLYRDSANTEVEYSSYSVRSEQDEDVYEVYFHLRQKTDYKVAIFAKRMTQDLFISQSIEKD
jgi:transglutaminase/protease-like cytokinesis protein 3